MRMKMIALKVSLRKLQKRKLWRNWIILKGKVAALQIKLKLWKTILPIRKSIRVADKKPRNIRQHIRGF